MERCNALVESALGLCGLCKLLACLPFKETTNLLQALGKGLCSHSFNPLNLSPELLHALHQLSFGWTLSRIHRDLGNFLVPLETTSITSSWFDMRVPTRIPAELFRFLKRSLFYILSIQERLNPPMHLVERKKTRSSLFLGNSS